MIKTLKIESSNVRLDKYLSSYFTNFSRKKIQYLIKSGKVLLDSFPIKDISYIVHIGEKFSVDFNHLENKDQLPSFNLKLNIIYEDEHLAVIDKPSGIVTHPGCGTKNDTLVNALIHHYNKNLSALKTIRPGIVHRLDKETSGLIIIAKNDKTHKLIANLIENRELTRKYIGLIWGEIGNEGIIETRIAKHRSNKMMIISSHRGKIAITKYKTLNIMQSTYGISSLIEFKLETGRTHQIRAHCLHKKCPIIGDKIYKYKTDSNLISRHALHSHKMHFMHPIKNETIKLKSKIPNDMLQLIDILNENNS